MTPAILSQVHPAETVWPFSQSAENTSVRRDYILFPGSCPRGSAGLRLQSDGCTLVRETGAARGKRPDM